MKRKYRMEPNDKKKNNKGFFNMFSKKEKGEEKGTKTSYKLREDSTFGRTMNQVSSRAIAPPSRRIKKVQESIYDEIDLGSEELKSIEEFHKSEKSHEDSIADQSSIKINTRFQVEKVTDDFYAKLENVNEITKTSTGSLENKSINNLTNTEKSSSKRSSKISMRSSPKIEEKMHKVNFNQKLGSSDNLKSNLDKISSESLENINRRKSKGRSKSAFIPGNFHLEEPKRRAIIDVFKKMDEANLGIDKPAVPNHRASVFARRETGDSGEYNDIESKSQNDLDGDLLAFQEKYRAQEEAKESISGSVAVSIIYGLILCLGGMFVSFDSLAGNLGEYRYISTGYYVFLYCVGIFSILFVFHDYKKFVETLTQSDSTVKFDRNQGNRNQIYGSTTKPGGAYDLYGTNYEANSNPKRYLEPGFSGYLVDQNVPFNMYLKIGLGIFCVITLLQCCIGMAEAVENFINGITDCAIETNEGIVSFFHFFFTSLQLIFIFLRGNIVICRNPYWSHLFTMHIAMTNLIVWFKNILLETLDEYYEHILHEELGYNTNHSYIYNSSSLSNTTIAIKDCHEPKEVLIKKFVLKVKPYLYPGTIEFSITCATIFLIMWYKTNKRIAKCLSLPPAKTNFQDVGIVDVPFTNLLTIVDCTKTFKGIFFGILAFVATVMSTILFFIYSDKLPTVSKFVTEITEISLLFIALVATIYSYRLIIKHYSKANLPVNMFDVVLEVFSLGGIIAYSVNNLIAIFYGWAHNQQVIVTQIEYRAGTSGEDLTKNATSAVAAILQIIQGCVQTLFILECLKRYASKDSPFLRKPARSLITFLLILNVSMWIFDTFSAKRFNAKNYLIDYYGILKWSIINAFSAPIAIFYRFHSSVCLSDIWISLYYGEYEEHVEDNKSI